jgi:hypothetical protein
MSELQEKFRDEYVNSLSTQKEEGLNDTDHKQKEADSTVKIRYYIEYEYAESFQFFSLFKKLGSSSSGARQNELGLGIERCVEVSAIMYQDFYRQGSIMAKKGDLEAL